MADNFSDIEDMGKPIIPPDLARLPIETLRIVLAARGFLVIGAEHVKEAYTSVTVPNRPNNVRRLEGVKVDMLEALANFVRPCVSFRVHPTNKDPELYSDHRAMLVVVTQEGYAEATQDVFPLFQAIRKGQKHD